MVGTLQSPYRGERELDGVEKALGEIPKPAQLGGAVVGVLAAGAVGVLAGGRAAPGKTLVAPARNIVFGAGTQVPMLSVCVWEQLVDVKGRGLAAPCGWR